MPIKVDGLDKFRTIRGVYDIDKGYSTWIYVCKKCGVEADVFEDRGLVVVRCRDCGEEELIGGYIDRVI